MKAIDEKNRLKNLLLNVFTFGLAILVMVASYRTSEGPDAFGGSAATTFEHAVAEGDDLS